MSERFISLAALRAWAANRIKDPADAATPAARERTRGWNDLARELQRYLAKVAGQPIEEGRRKAPADEDDQTPMEDPT